MQDAKKTGAKMSDILPNDNQVLEIPQRQARWLLFLLLLASVFFAFGICLPMISITKFMVISNDFSIISAIHELWRNGQILLFIAVAGFSVVLPIMKIMVLFKLLSIKLSNNLKTQRYLHLMHEYGRWAMLDVMVVAVLIVTVKLGPIVSIKVHSGLFVFGAAVLLIMLITQKVVALTKQR